MEASGARAAVPTALDPVDSRAQSIDNPAGPRRAEPGPVVDASKQTGAVRLGRRERQRRRTSRAEG